MYRTIILLNICLGPLHARAVEINSKEKQDPDMLPEDFPNSTTYDNAFGTIPVLSKDNLNGSFCFLQILSKVVKQWIVDQNLGKPQSSNVTANVYLKFENLSSHIINNFISLMKDYDELNKMINVTELAENRTKAVPPDIGKTIDENKKRYKERIQQSSIIFGNKNLSDSGSKLLNKMETEPNKAQSASYVVPIFLIIIICLIVYIGYLHRTIQSVQENKTDIELNEF